MANLELKQINKIYNNGFQAVENFNLKIEDGEFIVLVGPSGCGKTTVLRMIAGLETITDGELYMDNYLMNNMAAKDRNIAMVFQSYALFPHLTVYENISFPLKILKLDKRDTHAKVKDAAKILEIEPLLDEKPNTLSGGQKQRVALGRAIVRNPKVFLMDEPLSNLDFKLRNQMRIEISRLHRKLNSTFIYVTHDQTEAMTMGTRVVIMNDGKIHQVGTPQEVYENPNDIFVARFVGSLPMNIFDGTVIIDEDEVQLKVCIQKNNEYNIAYLKLSKNKQDNLRNSDYVNKKVRIGIRPEDTIFGTHEHDNILKTHVTMVEKMGIDTYIYFDVHGENCISKTSIKNDVEIDDYVSFYVDERKIHLFDYDTKIRIF